MTLRNILRFSCREQFRDWLVSHHANESECWVTVKKGRPMGEDCLYYLDAVEEALCFGWIDSTNRTHEGCTLQRFSPRKKNSPWSELNIERCRRLDIMGLMTDAGRSVMPKDERTFTIDPVIMRAFRANHTAWEHFCAMPELYRRVRIDTIQRDKHKDLETFKKRLERLIRFSERGQLFGDWNDYGRLLDYDAGP